MYVREAKNREEVWLLDHLEMLGLEDPAFRSRDYVVAIDEASNEKAGFGRIRIHPGEPEVCELTAIGVLPGWREQGVGAHVVERLVDHASDAGFDAVFVVTDQVEYFTQFGFDPTDASELPEPIRERLEARREADADAIGLRIDVAAFEMPERHRESFKMADERLEPDVEDEADDDELDELVEEFGIDPDEATYKYDTGR
ncbi:MAG: GNAT family N-acetyltransferase [Halobacteriales archaeon]